jgi:hypothetical protein
VEAVECPADGACGSSELPLADNSPLAPCRLPLRSRLSGDVGHGGLGLRGRARDPIAFTVGTKRPRASRGVCLPPAPSRGPAHRWTSALV